MIKNVLLFCGGVHVALAPRKCSPGSGGCLPPFFSKLLLAYPKVADYETILRETASDRAAAMSAESNELCPPREMFLKQTKGLITQVGLLDEGSESKIFLYSDPSQSQTFIVKSVNAHCDEVIAEALVNEKAVMRALAGDMLIPRMFDIDETAGMSDSCRARSYVTQMLGEPLDGLYDKLVTNKAVLREVISQAFDILKNLHDAGFVHGDIHGGNFLLQKQIVPDHLKLHLIDFGLTVAYVDAHGSHVSNEPLGAAIREPRKRFSLSRFFGRRHKKSIPAAGDNQIDKSSAASTADETVDSAAATSQKGRYPGYLPIWHLESGHIATYRVSRRDDMFRLADILYLLSSSEYRLFWDLAEKNEETITDYDTLAAFWLDTKKLLIKSNNIDPTFPLVFREFYVAMSKMEYTEEPAYDFWKQRFVSALTL